MKTLRPLVDQSNNSKDHREVWALTGARQAQKSRCPLRAGVTSPD